jgi:hypothetical protein
MFDRLDPLTGWLWLAALQSTAWLAVGLLLSRRLADRPARAHRLLGLTLAAAVFTPALAGLVALGGWGLFEGPGPAVHFRLVHPADEPQPLRVPWSVWLAGMWAGASLALLGTLFAAVRRAQRLVDRGMSVDGPRLLATLRAEAAAAGVPAPRLLMLPGLVGPVAWSGPHPAVLIPPGWPAAGTDPAPILRHELAHLRRRDHLTALLAEAAVALLAWHPLAWWARQRLALYAEFACDDAVLLGGTPVADYAEALLGLVAPPALGLPAAGHLSWRVRRLVQLDKVRPAVRCRRWLLAVGGVVLAASVGLALLQTRPGPKDDFLRQPLPAKAAARP